MKKTFTFLLFSIITFSYSQNISGIILDSISKKPLELASVTLNKTNRGVYSDAEGKFKISLTNENDYLLISYLGYTTKKVCASNFIKTKENNSIFYLSSTTERLNEVFVQNKKTEYGWSQSIQSKRENTRFFGFQFGTENCTYIKNSEHKKGKITAVILDLKKITQYNKDNPKWKLDYISNYNIKFYEIDLQNNRPGAEIYNKDIIVNPENKTRNFKINTDSLNIPFPESGVCVGVEMINTRYKNPKEVFATIGPRINFTENRDANPVMAWSRFRYDKEWKFEPVARIQDRKGRRYNMMIVDLIIKPEK
ncbi:carboxypeptidase-like regulatory domain-containing protein [Flavobacterium psychrophilum]|uniref:carboxypeptidase-like regulatory domain-containing protein n=1 Tax=Flavobacterium psychrophilum TaxID=96345 RepID=UPI001C8F5721|nr:carboxypeptidase-like regulatory domain-containing protein [Flavobacterium psychrophilum]EKT4499282.1 carboxypeptidase-like regulatory domain-containing protein [Flavobacterium psychrophilum]ELM3650498.1 carboxypeptidase-like regulatory domain-containing protein [Flavobacterium psychrophilum]ELM3671818.1 carboxypeptidase-like regulatory domain-containing protein [Flavobacterium psychrophilum]ELM3726570.1 carboxypeptidase-like regulatory domain-containing protein [Flavobacterium psychrophilum